MLTWCIPDNTKKFQRTVVFLALSPNYVRPISSHNIFSNLFCKWYKKNILVTIFKDTNTTYLSTHLEFQSRHPFPLMVQIKEAKKTRETGIYGESATYEPLSLTFINAILLCLHFMKCASSRERGSFQIMWPISRL